MIALRTSTVVDAPPDVVWADLSDIRSHVEWMVDVVAIRFTSAGDVGVGSTYEVDTHLGPIRLNDRLEITDWRPGEALAVRRGGVVMGEGRFTLEALAQDRTRVTRDMHLGFPWWMGGVVGERVAAPVLRVLFRSNLRAFGSRHEAAG